MEYVASDNFGAVNSSMSLSSGDNLFLFMLTASLQKNGRQGFSCIMKVVEYLISYMIFFLHELQGSLFYCCPPKFSKYKSLNNLWHFSERGNTGYCTY